MEPSANNSSSPIKLFISYAREDKLLKNELITCLGTSIRQGKITLWQDVDIKGGEEWEKRIRHEIDQAEIILLLISANFINSDFIWNFEINTAYKKHQEGSAKVIPILLKECHWEIEPIKNLQFVPSDAKPIGGLPKKNRDKAYTIIAREIDKIAGELITGKKSEQNIRDTSQDTSEPLATIADSCPDKNDSPIPKLNTNFSNQPIDLGNDENFSQKNDRLPPPHHSLFTKSEEDTVPLNSKISNTTSEVSVDHKVQPDSNSILVKTSNGTSGDKKLWNFNAKTWWIWIFLLAIISLAALTLYLKNNDPSHEVQITELAPDSGKVGEKLIIKGHNFDINTRNNIVKVNGVEASIIEGDSSKLVVEIPRTKGSGKVTLITYGDTILSSDNFTIYSEIPPANSMHKLKIESLSKTTGSLGDRIIIKGNNFGEAPAKNTVTFNGTNAQVLTATTSTLSVRVPEGATNGRIKVVVGDQSDETQFFTINTPSPEIKPAPNPILITGLSQTSGAPGDHITINGNNFNPSLDKNTVYFNQLVAEILAISSTSITIKVPDGATSSRIKLVTNNQSYIYPQLFTVNIAPPELARIISLSQNSGAPGDHITINGSNFNPSLEKTTVYFKKIKAEILAISSTSITVEVPQGATSGRLSVRTEGSRGGPMVDFSVTTSQEEKIYNVVEVPPTFPGGNTELYKYLAKNIKYPSAAARANVTGRVIIGLVVTKTGRIDQTSVSVIKGLGYGADEEAIRVVKAMPNWIPGKQNGIAVNVKYNLPIHFSN